jgi:predicted RNA binding protein YcfA (HicA-like mRNA interferase family)/ketosteroid isomerase-like protein
MQASHARLVLNDVYASWERGDLLTTLSYFAKNVVFAVHSSPDAASLIGHGIGRDDFGSRLELFLRKFQVEAFKLQHPVTVNGIWLQSRVAFKYRHRASGWDVDGTMRHKWRFVGDEIAHFELFLDRVPLRDVERGGSERTRRTGLTDWPVTKARRVLAALQRIDWKIKRQSGSHRTLSRSGWPDFFFAFHDGEEIGPRMLARIAKSTGLKSEDL